MRHLLLSPLSDEMQRPLDNDYGVITLGLRSVKCLARALRKVEDGVGILAEAP